MNGRFSFLRPALCCAGLLSLPQVAVADATSYWSGVDVPSRITSSLYPYIGYSAYTCVANYYVSTSGSDSYSGTSGAPWRTISHAVSVLGNRGSLGGVCVNVAPGTYSETVYLDGLGGNADALTGYLVFRSSTARAAKIQAPSGNGKQNVIIDHARFVVFDGFELTGRTDPNAWAGGYFAMNSHHIKIINNIVHDVGSAGIGAIWSDYVIVQDNVVYNTSCCDNGVSGIDLWAARASDSNPGFHNRISRNIVYNADDKGSLSEGHGIILDNFRSTGYDRATLIESNLVYHNGGAGIALWYTDNTTIRNNTAFDDYRDDLYPAGEITVANSSHTVVVNNIAVANRTSNSSIYTLFDQTWDNTNIGNVWSTNLTYDGNSGESAATDFTYCDCGNNTKSKALLGKNPLFVNPAAGDFRLQPGSPAVDSGTTSYGYPANDLDGNLRLSMPSIGAYELQ